MTALLDRFEQRGTAGRFEYPLGPRNGDFGHAERLPRAPGSVIRAGDCGLCPPGTRTPTSNCKDSSGAIGTSQRLWMKDAFDRAWKNREHRATAHAPAVTLTQVELKGRNLHDE